METVKLFFSEAFRNIWRQLSLIKPLDILDVIVLALLLFSLYRFIRDRRAGRLAAGVLVVLVVLVICEIFELNAMRYLLQNVMQVGIIALLILFQPELRSALETVGNQPIKGFKSLSETKEIARLNSSVNAICDAVAEMSRSRTGALIVIERETKLKDIVATGVSIDADLNPYLLRNIFYEGAPLHDGAVIISDYRINAAGCYLPLSQNQDITKEVGTRHRAAVGMSEISDAVVVCVSEETGLISLAISGELTRGYNSATLNRKLTEELSAPDLLRRIRKKEKAVSGTVKEAK